ncbi:hypothetical protein [Kordiimonas aquimaris]|uniref:hypothetical protein n=1 Tax=Kordiimonas aquimaris TaxID=707591 RepID=UPI0021D08E23|nr:hypothetical protein [Kordiimonas aquimaris]
MSTATKNAGKGIYEKSIKSIANLSAIVAAFFATGPLYSLSIDWVLGFSTSQYGDQANWLVQAFWFVVVGLSTFALARATIATAITVGGFALAARIF